MAIDSGSNRPERRFSVIEVLDRMFQDSTVTFFRSPGVSTSLVAARDAGYVSSDQIEEVVSDSRFDCLFTAGVNFSKDVSARLLDEFLLRLSDLTGPLGVAGNLLDLLIQKGRIDEGKKVSILKTGSSVGPSEMFDWVISFYNTFVPKNERMMRRGVASVTLRGASSVLDNLEQDGILDMDDDDFGRVLAAVDDLLQKVIELGSAKPHKHDIH